MADYQVPAAITDTATQAPPDLSADGVSKFLDMLNGASSPEALNASHAAQPTVIGDDAKIDIPSAGGGSLSVPAPAPVADIGQTTGVSLLNNIFEAQKQQLVEQGKAGQRVTDIINTNQTAQDAAYDAILKARGNMVKINTLGGPTSPIVKVLSLFDHSYSTVDNQISIESAAVQAEQAATRAKTMTELANTGPQSAALATQLAKDSYTLYSDARKNFVADQQLANERDRTHIEAAKLMAEIPEKNRQAVQDAVDKLPSQVVVGELAKINAGKPSAYLPVAGLLKQRILKEQQAELGIQQTQQAVIKGSRENAIEGMRLTLGNLPDSLLNSAIQAANKAGSAEVQIGKMRFPTTLAMEAYNTNLANKQKYQAAAADELGHEAQIPERYEQLAGSVAMLSGSSSVAPSELKLLNNQLAGTDTKTYDGIQQASAIIDSSNKRVTAIAQQVAAQFKTPEAKAAVLDAAANGGKFNKPGADAVVSEGLGNLSTQPGTLFGVGDNSVNAFLNAQFKSAITKTQLTPGQAGKIDITSLLAGMQKDGIEMMKEKVLTDPATRLGEAQRIESTIQPRALQTAVGALAKAQGAPALWQQLQATNFKDFRNQQGQIDLQAVTTFLGRQTLAGDGRIDYTKALQTQLESQLATNPLAMDPALTLTDRAELGRIYGPDAHAIIMGKYINGYRNYAIQVQQELQAAIQKDLTGRSGETLPNTPYMPVPETGLWAGVDSQSPSATGIPGWTVGDVLRKYGRPPVQPAKGR